MNKYRLEIELDVWGDDSTQAKEQFIDKLNELIKHFRNVPMEYIINELKDGGPPIGGITGGPFVTIQDPITLVSPGWKCYFRFIKPED